MQNSKNPLTLIYQLSIAYPNMDSIVSTRNPLFGDNEVVTEPLLNQAEETQDQVVVDMSQVNLTGPTPLSFDHEVSEVNVTRQPEPVEEQELESSFLSELLACGRSILGGLRTCGAEFKECCVDDCLRILCGTGRDRAEWAILIGGGAATTIGGSLFFGYVLHWYLTALLFTVGGPVGGAILYMLCPCLPDWIVNAAESLIGNAEKLVEAIKKCFQEEELAEELVE